MSRPQAAGGMAAASSSRPPQRDVIMLNLCKYLLLLSSVVATVTYAAGFNPPGGVWQETDAAAGHLAGDPIIRATQYRRYLVFFYCNAAAFALSLVVTVLLLAILHEGDSAGHVFFFPLRLAMVLDLASLMEAYAAGTCRDTLTAVYSTVLVAGVLAYIIIRMCRQRRDAFHSGLSDVLTPAEEKQLLRDRKVQMLLATFAVSVTYAAGLSTPGGFWESSEGGHRAGEAILKDHRHRVRLTAFFVCNTTAFAASLVVIVVLLLDSKVVANKVYACDGVALAGLLGAYAAGSCRETETTLYVAALVLAGALCHLLLFWVLPRLPNCGPLNFIGAKYNAAQESVSGYMRVIRDAPGAQDESSKEALEKARSLVLLLATLATAIAYQAGLDPPGGLWQDNSDGHTAGDPILLTTNARRYKAFFFCNSVAFVASLVAIVFVHTDLLLQHQVLELAMVLGLFGLIGAYAAGSCRDVSTSIYVVGLAGAVMVYVVIHVIFVTLGNSSHGDDENPKLLERRRKRLLLFAILAATITYQAGLTPPGGFRLRDDESGHHAGDPVLLYNYPRRYKAFFYCNSVSFMLSIALIVLLVNPHVYKPAIRSHALSLCSVVGLFGLMGAYAAGGTQHLKTSVYIFMLVAVVIGFVVLLLLGFLDWAINMPDEQEEPQHGQAKENERHLNQDPEGTEQEPHHEEEEEEEEKKKKKKEEEEKKKKEEEEKKKHQAMRKYLMLLGILVASVTYQAGLEPPGGVWQNTSSIHDAGDPVMYGNRRSRYLAFFYSNSASFMASIVVIVFLLLPEKMRGNPRWLGALNATIVLDLLGLLGAYAVGSSRGWRTSAYVVGLVVAVLAYIALHVTMSWHVRRKRDAEALVISV